MKALKSKRILIAEDSTILQTLTKKILQVRQYDIHTASTGLEALNEVGKQDFDVILMDINMPEMDGISCLQEVRKLPNKTKSNTPVIAVTGNAKNFTKDDFKAAGFDDYLPKPLNFDELVETVRKYSSINAD